MNDFPSAPVATPEERNIASLTHLSALACAWFALGIIGPLISLLWQGPKSQFVKAHATEAVNFNITMLIAILVSGVLTTVLIGFPMLAAIGVLYLVETIRAAMAASRGELFRYAATLRFIN